MLLGYLLHEDNLSETIERTVGIIEDVEHHITLAAIKAIRGQLLLLPYRAHLALHILIFREISQLLEFINAHDNPDFLFLRQQLWQLENRHLISFLRHKLQVESHKIRNLIVNHYLWNYTRQELLGILYPTFYLGRSAGYDLTGKSAIEFCFRADTESIYIADSHLLVFRTQFRHCLLYKRRFSPSTWRNEHHVDMGSQELLEQSPVFRPVDKILFGSQSTKLKRRLKYCHILLIKFVLPALFNSYHLQIYKKLPKGNLP